MSRPGPKDMYEVTATTADGVRYTFFVERVRGANKVNGWMTNPAYRMYADEDEIWGHEKGKPRATIRKPLAVGEKIFVYERGKKPLSTREGETFVDMTVTDVRRVVPSHTAHYNS